MVYGSACGGDSKPVEHPITEANQASETPSSPTSVAAETAKSAGETNTTTDVPTPTMTPMPATTSKAIPTAMPTPVTKTVESQPLPTVVAAITQVTPTPTPKVATPTLPSIEDSNTSNPCDVLTGQEKANCEKMMKDGKKTEGEDPCVSLSGSLKDMCENMMKPDTGSQHGSGGGHVMSNPCTELSGENKRRCELEIANDPMFGGSGVGYVKNFDPNNIPKIAKFNYVELDKLGRTSKFRSVNGHDFSFNTSEYDPTGKNCRSMKHYMVPLGAPRKNADYNSTPHLFEWMSIKFFAPADGVIGNVEDKQEHGELEQQFTIQSTEYPGYYFGFYHVKLDPSLENGSEVKAGQQIGTLGNEESYAEISVEARINSREIHLMSFLEVATDEVFDEYRARGVNSLSDVIITKEERDARPYGCDRNSEAGWFDGSYKYNADIAFMTWVYESSEEWFFFDE